MSSQAAGEARQAAGHDPYDLYGALRKVETTDPISRNAWPFMILIEVEDSFQLFAQWIRRRLSRGRSCRVWSPLHLGGLRSGLWCPLHGLDHPAGTGQEEERSRAC